MKKLPIPRPLIPSPRWLLQKRSKGETYYASFPDHDSLSSEDMGHDLTICIDHLLKFDGATGTMESYRCECNRFLNWAWLIAGKSLIAIRKNDIDEYIEFCVSPPPDWLAYDTPVQFFYSDDGHIQPNVEWRPFAVSVISNASLNTIFSRLSSLFQCTTLLESIGHNPVKISRQGNKLKRRTQGKSTPRILNKDQIKYCINVIEQSRNSAESTRDILTTERSLFIFSICLGLYLRISEVVGHKKFSSTHGDFHIDNDGNWWLKVVTNNEVERSISLSNDVLEALIRWRNVLGLTALPTSDDNTPMFPSLSNGFWDSKSESLSELVSVTDTLIIHKTFRLIFKMAHRQMLKEGKEEDATELLAASTSWLRHTGITNDTENRPLEHVSDDAGHSTLEITMNYSNTNNRERALSKKMAVRRTSNGS